MCRRTWPHKLRRDQRRTSLVNVWAWMWICWPGLGITQSIEPQAPPPEVPREFRGVWVATVENIDWPSRPGLPADEQQRELSDLLNRARESGLNAIVFQVRPACDALYKSSLEPWSQYLSGEIGRGPDRDYDPLTFAIEEAHRRGLELHAWFNPFRAALRDSMQSFPPQHVSRAHPEWVVEYGKYLWLDPGNPRAVEHSLQVILDVVRRYDVDGVHIDDYFYPYPITNDGGQKIDFPDRQTYENRVDAERQLGLADWRRQNVNRFVERLYRQVKQTRPSVKVGISPFGIWRPGHPDTIQGFDAYAEIYADARLWLQNGWLDYIAPQLYWKIDSPAQSYPLLLRWWQQQNRMQRHLWPGNYVSRLGVPSSGWRADEILDQVRRTREQEGATGNIFFSMKALLQDYDGIAQRLPREVYPQIALTPATPWLDDRRPAAPEVEWVTPERCRFHPRDDVPIRWWLIREQAAGIWNIYLLPSGTAEFHRRKSDASSPTAFGPVVVNAVSHTGILSEDVWSTN